MSSAICQNFVQNAWKKELCSNCFKSKDEHASQPKPKSINLISKESVEGIIKNSSRFKPKRSVCFTKELVEIIGFGGEDWDSDEEDCTYKETESSDEDYITESEGESEKELKKITKENTDFNTNNLKGESEIKKTTQLLLGKPLVDANGRKQTLMVSVTPFGEETTQNSKRVIKSISNSSISKTSNKESICDTDQTNVVLTSFTNYEDDSKVKVEEESLLDEITKTLENSKNPIEIMGKRKNNKNTVLSAPKNVQTEDIEKNVALKFSDRKIGLTRTPALKSQERPVVYQTSTAKIELFKTKSEVNEETPKFISNKTMKFEDNSAILTAGENLNTNSSIGTTGVKRLETLNYSKSNLFSQSREQAGEPDGRADPETVFEPPALPLTPPPLIEKQNSFSNENSLIYKKPKIPPRPIDILLEKSVVINRQDENENQIVSSFDEDLNNKKPKKSLSKQDSTEYDSNSRVVNKRRAPKPPEDHVDTDSTLNLMKDSPPIYEKGNVKKESLGNLKSRDNKTTAPEPPPRKLLSGSTDSVHERKSKDQSKGRFSLKKFLKMGNRKDAQKLEPSRSEETSNNPPLLKPRLVIVHPLELNGARVEVLTKSAYQDDYQNLRIAKNPEYNIANSQVYANHNSLSQKPSPPPRNVDLTGHKANLLHPPKSSEILQKQKKYSNDNSKKNSETVYANIGEVRSAIVPNKPQRTASMREHEVRHHNEQKSCNDNYEPINTNYVENEENVYDYISGRSSSPESDISHNKRHSNYRTATLNNRSESSIDISGNYFKYENLPRSLSLTYCGSETESEIYSPNSFCENESEVLEDDWPQSRRTHKLCFRKGRSIVHKNLEDNYGAVTGANHEALAQVLENIQQQTYYIPPPLKGLKFSPNLRWTDFSIKSSSQCVTVGSRTFQHAVWNTRHVTLVINTGARPSSTLALGTYGLSPIAEFNDLVPVKFLSDDKDDKEKDVQATVTVLPWLQVNTIESYSKSLKLKGSQIHGDTWRSASFVMLQLVNALKVLQAQGIEELSLSLNSFVLCKEMDKENYHRLCVLQGLSEENHLKTDSEQYGTLCMCASKALSLLQPTSQITSLIQSLLNNERAVTLTQVKSVLEFCLWGPSDVVLGNTIQERELALQRWLDLQRATVLHGLVCARIQLTVYEECHLFFLVRSNVRMMCDASLLLESSNVKHVLINGNE